jgi:hypothetical protein
MDDNPVALLPKLAEEPALLPFGHADLFGRLLLCDQFLLGPFSGPPAGLARPGSSAVVISTLPK